ncbi:MAG: N-acetylmuramoyl-L-alanine amidase family protein [Saprospiraceae bacterium]
MRLSTLLFFLLFFNVLNAQTYLTSKAKAKDNIITFLARYQMSDYQCNIEKFQVLNKLKGSKLTPNKKYKLPIKVFKYNGKSIRTTTGIKNYQRAKRIQNYNEALTRAKVKSKDYRIDNILWVPQHEISCKTSTKEAPTNFGRVFPIFGSEYQYVPLQSESLKGKIYYIVSGHGGPDPGAVNRQNSKKYCEDEYAYDIALRLARNLVAHGATTYMIVRDPNDGIRSGEYLAADKDEVCWRNQKIPREQKKRLAQRANAINKLYEHHKKRGVKAKDQRTVIVHIDSRKVKKRVDVFFYHFPGSSKGKKFATNLQKTIKKEYSKSQSNRGYSGTVKSRDLFMLRETKPTTAYIELGNIKNPADQKRFLIENNRQALANWLLKGLMIDAKN